MASSVILYPSFEANSLIQRLFSLSNISQKTIVFSLPATLTRLFGRFTEEVSVVVTIRVQSSWGLAPKSDRAEYVSSVFFTFS